MTKKRTVYWTALIATGVVSFGLHAWAAWLWMSERWASGAFEGWRGFHGASGMAMHSGGVALMSVAFWFAVLVVGFLVFWHRRSQPARIDPLADLAGEYVEGRLGREEYRTRRAVLEEQR